jgi:hypothetical protein
LVRITGQSGPQGIRAPDRWLWCGRAANQQPGDQNAEARTGRRFANGSAQQQPHRPAFTHCEITFTLCFARNDHVSGLRVREAPDIAMSKLKSGAPGRFEARYVYQGWSGRWQGRAGRQRVRPRPTDGRYRPPRRPVPARPACPQHPPGGHRAMTGGRPVQWERRSGGVRTAGGGPGLGPGAVTLC